MARFFVFLEMKWTNVRFVGRNKLIINHLGRLFVTSDAATIIRELEVVHPAAKLLVMSSQAQEAEVCDQSIFNYFKVLKRIPDG